MNPKSEPTSPKHTQSKLPEHAKQCSAMQGRAELGRTKQNRAITENILSSPKRTKSQLTCLSPRFGKNTKHEKKKFD